MTAFVVNVLLALIWSVTIGDFTPANFLFGLALGYVALRIAWNRGSRAPNPYFDKLPKIISFAAFFLKELISANVKVAVQTLSRIDTLRPAIVAIPIEPMSDTEITLLANLITLTPGTLSMDVSGDRSTLFVHFMHVEDAEAQRREIKDGFERRVLEVMR
ncbi:MAG: Na+/H+ antiporter subunit E [Planctomycetota bacterium]